MVKTQKHIAIIDSQILAEYILFKYGPMSHLKLQKLLYYVQALHLAYFDKEVIEDDFEAWVHGPVSRKVFNNIRDYSLLYDEMAYVQNEYEQTPDVLMRSTLTEEQIELIDEVLQEYSPLSSLKLEALTHAESPWINARTGYSAGDRCNVIIRKDIMKDFYKSQVYGQSQS